ncbi:MAG TPA: CTQ-dependent lysine 6-oxidase LodA [Thermoanaerobaculia bacterium]|jgi:L-lysine 6-oxidase|nr:CTQ-dependent lysine 6-oxidase LodA [Thermoanaerobaculia bacterium]
MANRNWDRREFLTVTAAAAAAAAVAINADAQTKKKKPSGKVRYQIHPAIGVARLGDSPDSFYLEPETIGGLPIECDANGNERRGADGKPEFVRKFKKDGRIRRQGARFRLFAFDAEDPDDPGREVTLKDSEIESVQWTVHLANKKGCWYNNDELRGNMTLGPQSKYYEEDTFRNPDVTDRQSLIIDPGPRTLSSPGDKAAFSRATIPKDYPHGSFPDLKSKRIPYQINTLGNAMMDADGRLVVVAGLGHAGGEVPIATYTGQDTWYDDTADGPVTCKLKVRGMAEPLTLTAWALVGSPKYAPQLVNIVTLDDIMYDVGVRFQNLRPDMYAAGRFNANFMASYERDIAPIIERPADYVWVANLPSMVPFTALRFDPRDPSAANAKNRQAYFSYFRDPGQDELSPGNNELFTGNVPAMPLNSGTNSVTNDQVSKWMPLTITQYFLLGQWAKGKFTAGKAVPPLRGVHPLDQASVGNCNGSPMSPGIEVTWTTRNPVIYEAPYRIRHYADEEYYKQNGLTPGRDETYQTGTGPWRPGSEPGDLTKRMSPPWMADFYQCSIEYVTFATPLNTTRITEIPPSPTYYAYWWPPQSPMYVITGDMTKEEQMAAGVPAGYSVYFNRGSNNIGNLVVSWAYMGFIVNVNDRAEGRQFPYFVERERNHDKFVASTVAVGSPVNQLAGSGSYLTPTNQFFPMWYLREEAEIAECDGVPNCDQ